MNELEDQDICVEALKWDIASAVVMLVGFLMAVPGAYLMYFTPYMTIGVILLSVGFLFMATISYVFKMIARKKREKYRPDDFS